MPSGDASPEKVDEIANRMLAQLAVSERKQQFLDPDDVPGGRWMIAGVGGAITLLVLLCLAAILGALLNR